MRTSAVASGVLAALLLLLVAVQWSPLLSFDRSVAEALHRSALAHPGFTRVNRALSDGAWDPWTMRTLGAGAAVLLWWRRERRAALWVVGTLLFAVGLEQGLKALVGRDRPRWSDPVDSAQYAAFPSGHALTATVACGLLLWVLALHWRAGWRGWGTLAGAAVVSVLGVGWTRVYLGVHWPSDVLEGWLLGWCCVVAAVLGYRRGGRRSGKRGEDGADGPGSSGSRMGETK
ncbi:phosphatase PAP2 family protein [Streptomyces sp. NPDC058872]|uniref:phosphatase PAP2 family protein n=1 Tax=Streptomyces sp. NPDC058872 TaxID=3346661 RepID=UPI00367E6096